MKSFRLSYGARLRKCGTCGGKLASSAKHCPHCGARRKTVSGSIGQFGCALVAMGILLPILFLILVALTSK